MLFTPEIYNELIDECLDILKEVGKKQAVNLIPSMHVKYVIDNVATRRLGYCRTAYGEATIGVNKKYAEAAESYDDIRTVILHEILHARTPGDGHTKQWKHYGFLVSIETPYNITRLLSSKDMVKYYKHTCPNCGEERLYIKKLKSMHDYCCNKCNTPMEVYRLINQSDEYTKVPSVWVQEKSKSKSKIKEQLIVGKKKYKYALQCTCCGAQFKYTKRCKSTECPENYHCTKCGIVKGRLELIHL